MQLVTQFPVVFALRLGVNDISSLVYLHSFGLIGVPALVWLAAMLLHLKSDCFWVVLLAYSITCLTSGFFAIGEYNLAYALVGFCFAVLMQRKIGLISAAFAVAAALVLVRSYESMVFLAPLLGYWALKTLVAGWSDMSLAWRVLVMGMVAAFVAAFLVSAWSIAYPRDPANFENAKKVWRVFKTGHFFVIIVSISAFFLVREPQRNAGGRLFWMAIALITIYAAAKPLWLSPSHSYSFRTMSGVLLFCVFFIVLVKGEVSPMWSRVLADERLMNVRKKIIATALFFSLAVASVVQTVEFSGWINKFEAEARNAKGWVHIDELPVLLGPNKKFAWNWSAPTLSIILRGDVAGGVLNHSAFDGAQPFEPRDFLQNPLGHLRKNSGLISLLPESR